MSRRILLQASLEPGAAAALSKAANVDPRTARKAMRGDPKIRPSVARRIAKVATAQQQQGEVLQAVSEVLHGIAPLLRDVSTLDAEARSGLAQAIEAANRIAMLTIGGTK